MEHDAGGVDDGAQGISKSGAEFAIDGGSESGESEVDSIFIDGVAGDFVAKAIEDCADRGCDWGLTVAGDERLEIG
jgi:hypothetical protein